MIKPVIHLNGSGKANLEQQYRDASEALEKVIDALYKCAPHGRDYYPISDNAWLEARNEHWKRLEEINKVKEQINELLYHVWDSK